MTVLKGGYGNQVKSKGKHHSCELYSRWDNRLNIHMLTIIIQAHIPSTGIE